MSGIRAKDTKPEFLVRSYLHAAGFRYRLHVRALPGSPDLVLPRWRTVIFVNGCFWHRHAGCKYSYVPKSREGFWLAKFERNTARDAAAYVALEQAGWRVIVVWECTLRIKGRQTALAELADLIRSGMASGNIRTG